MLRSRPRLVAFMVVLAMLGVTSCSLLAASDSGTSPLFEAVSARNDAEARRLITGGADLDERNGLAGMTALMEATGFDDELVRVLLDSGASIELTDRQGWSALTYGVVRSSPTAVEILLSAGAPADVPTSGRFNNKDLCEISRIRLEDPLNLGHTDLEDRQEVEHRQEVVDLVCN